MLNVFSVDSSSGGMADTTFEFCSLCVNSLNEVEIGENVFTVDVK